MQLFVTPDQVVASQIVKSANQWKSFRLGSIGNTVHTFHILGEHSRLQINQRRRNWYGMVLCAQAAVVHWQAPGEGAVSCNSKMQPLAVAVSP